MEKTTEEKPAPVEIPLDAIAPELLQKIAEEFVLREGTDYGVHEVSLEKKIEQVLKQLHRGDVKLYFDPETESVTLVNGKRRL